MIREYDLVYTNVDKGEFPAGTKGIVVSLYENSSGCEVEIWDEKGYPVDVVTFASDELTIEPCRSPSP